MPKKLEIKLRREARKAGYKGKKLNEFVRDNLYPTSVETEVIEITVPVEKKRGRPKKV